MGGSSYGNREIKGRGGLKFMAGLAGLEPTTHCLEGSCSVQMSYRPLRGVYYTIKGRGHAAAPPIPGYAAGQTASADFDHGSLPARSDGVVISGGTGRPSICSAVGATADSLARGVSLTPAESFAT